MVQNISLKVKILSGSGVTLALMIILGIVSIDSTNTLSTSNKAVDHTHVVIRTANEILAAAVDMETGMRGYLLAGEEGFLDPYHAGNSTFQTTIVSLQKTVDDNPRQVDLLGQAKTTVEQWQKKVVTPNIAMRRAIGHAKSMNDLAAEIGEAKGKVFFDGFRQKMALFITNESVLMIERQKSAIEAETARKNVQKLITDTVKWVNHTRNVIESANNIIAAAVNMETGVRGFLLAGKDEFLDPFKSGTVDFNKLIGALQQTVSDNPQQVTLLGRAEKTISDWKTKVIEPIIVLRRKVSSGQGTMTDISTEVAQAKGKVYFDGFREMMATFISREAVLMQQRKLTAVKAEQDREEAQNLITKTTYWVEHTKSDIKTANDIISAAVNMETGVRGYLLAGKDEFLEPFISGKATFKQLTNKLKQEVKDNPQQVSIVEQAAQTILDWEKKVIVPLIELRKKIGTSKTMDDIRDLTAKAEGKVYFDAFREQIATFTAREQALMVIRQQDAEKTSANSKSIIITGICIAVVIAIVISLILSGSITGPFKQIFQGLKTFSNMELDEVKQKFSQIISGMNSSSSQVADASQQIATGASQQAASLEEISSSLEEMSSMTKQNAENATEANGLAQEAQNGAESGVNAMTRMSDAIGKIKRSSDETAKIIKTIDEIAFQTNLLALNAAVEAARAGEAGKGFAVVAEEVRNLAQRSAEAAKDTSTLIEESQTNADNGVSVTKEVGDILHNIVEASGKVNALIGEVSAASTEQATGIGQLNTGVSQLDQVTQQNAASTEELSAQAKEMGSLMQLMMQVVGSGNPAGMGHDYSATSGTQLNQNIGYSTPVKPRTIPAARATKTEAIIPLDDSDFTDF